ncbi:hypothetical protein MEX01_53380 [Methylorubrum extorquens]|uniref:DUF6894 family protein n=1 Tax=Methylorubrum extorquens TaxID=408 RepID=UPI001166B86F|nr:hypothetical protein [Methylorubrum extorquens]GEL44747.1 hypothetical protein MEX01_53380 [Methylorubrum extorquens]
MARYRFHCTNGLECVFDAVGNDIRIPERLPRRAEEVAQSVMRSLDDQEDWSQWHVSVHDLSGRRVLVQPFMVHAGELNQAA